MDASTSTRHRTVRAPSAGEAAADGALIERDPAGGPAGGVGGREAGAEGVSVRERILDAARRHFFRLGFASCTMDCLARELGMSKKTLYQHFRSKEQIVDEILALKAAAIRAGFEAMLAESGVPFGARVARMMRHAHAEFSVVGAAFLHDLRRLMPAAYARLEEFRARVAPGIWERLLRIGIEEGAVRPETDPVFVGRLIPLAMQSLLHPDSLDRLALQPHEVVVRFFDLIFAGVLTPAGLESHARHIDSRSP